MNNVPYYFQRGWLVVIDICLYLSQSEGLLYIVPTTCLTYLLHMPNFHIVFVGGEMI